MQNKTQKSSERNDATLTAGNVFGMFEAGLQELSAHFTFDAVNTATGVTLTIPGIERIEHADGSWSLRVRQAK